MQCCITKPAALQVKKRDSVACRSSRSKLGKSVTSVMRRISANSMDEKLDENIMQFDLPSGLKPVPGTLTAPVLGEYHPTAAQYTDESGNAYQWHARWHRKGRYPVWEDAAHKPRQHLPRLLPLWFGYPFSNLSYWVGLVFTLGCIAWVVNGHYALYGVGAAAAGSKEGAEFTAAVAALFGGTLFEIGSWLLYWEALNQVPQVFTGKQVEQQKQQQQQQQQRQGQAVKQGSTNGVTPTPLPCGDAHPLKQVCVDTCDTQPYGDLAPSAMPAETLASSNGNRRDSTCNSNGNGNLSSSSSSGARFALKEQQLRQHVIAGQHVQAVEGSAVEWQEYLKQEWGDGRGRCCDKQRKWAWIGFRRNDVGFMASFLQLIGATIFWVPCIFGTPGVYSPEDSGNYRIWDGLYWLTQAVGATFFIVSALLFMFEEQPKWYLPQPQRIGWHVGFWNLVGAVGFFLSGLFGFWSEPSGVLQLGGTAVSTFWGSYAFLLGSYLQLLEALNTRWDNIKWGCC